MSCGTNSPYGINYLNPLGPCLVNPPAGSSGTYDSSTVIYTGPALTCSGIATNTNLQTILQTMDAKICASVSINWSSFNYYCLPTLCSCSITTAQQFVETMSNQFCILNSAYNTFVNTTYPAEITTLLGLINGIKAPGLTSCSAVNVGSGDSLNTVLTKILTNLCTINTETSTGLASANWNECFTVSPSPTTLIGAFNTVLDLICQTKALIPGDVTLPTFNNIGTCLASPGSADTLYNTVIKIRTLLCTLPTFTTSGLTWGCVTTGTDLQSTIQNLLTLTTTNRENSILQVDANFTLTPINGGNPCAGLKLNFVGAGSTDRLVASNHSDSSPGTLSDKVLPGTNVTLDFSDNTHMVINAVGPDHKVSVTSGDPTSDYLQAKLNIKPDSLNIVSWSSVYNSTTHQLDITPAINLVTLFTDGLNTIASDPTLLAQFCALTCGCQPCTTTTTTTTTISPDVVLSGIIANTGGSGNIPVTISFNQLSPNVSWYNPGMTTVNASTSFSTGAFTVTAATPVTGVVTLQNNDNVSITYNIYVKDDFGVSVPGSTTSTGTLTSSSILTVNPFTFGTSPNNYRLHIEFHI